MKEIIGALIKAQASITYAHKDATNPHFKNKYATLESVIDAIKQPLLDQKILIVHTQDIPTDTLVTTLYHESGEFMQTSSKLLLDRPSMQALGSAQTYAKRYNLTCLLNLPTEDDDGNAASLSEPIKMDNPGEYTIKFGKKLNGKKIKEINPADLSSYIYDYLESGAKKKNEPLTGDALELFTYGDAYLKSLGEKRPPALDTSEEIPF